MTVAPVPQRTIEVLSTSHRGDGKQNILKVQDGNSVYIVKSYGRKRGRIRTVLRDIGHWTYAWKSPLSARGRKVTEEATLALWQQNGFDVPHLLPLPAGDWGEHCIAMEYLTGCSLEDIIRDPETTLARKKELLAQFSAAWGARHQRALALREPALLFERPSLVHVWVCGDRLVNIDLEIVFRGRWRVGRLIDREVLNFVRHLAKCAGDQFPELLASMVASYPQREILERVPFRVRCDLVTAIVDWLLVRRRGRQRYSKLTMAGALERALAAQ